VNLTWYFSWPSCTLETQGCNGTVNSITGKFSYSLIYLATQSDCRTVHSALFPTWMCWHYPVCLKSFVELPITYPCGQNLMWTKTLMRHVKMWESQGEWYWTGSWMKINKMNLKIPVDLTVQVPCFFWHINLYWHSNFPTLPMISNLMCFNPKQINLHPDKVDRLWCQVSWCGAEEFTSVIMNVDSPN
jgi:hypothetical protein